MGWVRKNKVRCFERARDRNDADACRGIWEADVQGHRLCIFTSPLEDCVEENCRCLLLTLLNRFQNLH